MLFLFFFNDTATTEIYTLSLHDALPIWRGPDDVEYPLAGITTDGELRTMLVNKYPDRIGQVEVAHEYLAKVAELRSEEHTSELQSQSNLVCRLLLEKKNKNKTDYITIR